MNKALISLILAFVVSVMLFLVFMEIVKAEDCLTIEQKNVLNEVANTTNVSNITLISIFEILCEVDIRLNGSIVNSTVTLNESMYTLFKEVLDTHYNRTQINEKLNSTLTQITKWTEEEIEKTYAKALWNASEIERKLVLLETILDDKVRELKNELREIRKEYVIREEMNTVIENTTYTITSYVIANLPKDEWVKYLFWFFLLFFGVGILLYKIKPVWRGKFVLEKVRGEHRTIEEITTKEDLRKKREKLRHMRLTVAKSSLGKDKKVGLLGKIDKGEVENEEELSQEIEIEKEMEKSTKHR